MICQDCRNGYHEGCPGDTHCPCQHRGHQCSRECNHDDEKTALMELTQLTQLTQLSQEMGLE